MMNADIEALISRHPRREGDYPRLAGDGDITPPRSSESFRGRAGCNSTRSSMTRSRGAWRPCMRLPSRRRAGARCFLTAAPTGGKGSTAGDGNRDRTEMSDIKTWIDNEVKANDVVLFMKAP